MASAENMLMQALITAHPEGHAEAVLEAALVASWYARRPCEADLGSCIARADTRSLGSSLADAGRLDRRRHDDTTRSPARAGRRNPPPTLEVGAAFRWYLTAARTSLAAGDGNAFHAALSRAE